MRNWFWYWRRQIRLTLSLSYPFWELGFLESRLLRTACLVYASQKVDWEPGNVQIFAYSLAHFKGFRRRCLLAWWCLAVGVAFAFPLAFPFHFSLFTSVSVSVRFARLPNLSFAMSWMHSAGDWIAAAFLCFLGRQSVELHIQLTFSCKNSQQLLQFAFVEFELSSDFISL